MRVFVHMLVVLALVLSTISPACAFISGNQSMIEICGADGTLKTIAVDAAFDPFAETDPQPPHAEKPPCAFCLAMTSLKAAPPAQDIVLFVPPVAYGLTTGPGGFILTQTPALGFTPTGPPSFAVL